ncbi:T9SS type A sorting domain-containing protein [Maribellus mangrovi]|uniref:T9SS type A sorting domain-containing protein n=1 Tax=Maribellus mangrovi TaxID=3133146 RepID=UPI0030EDE8D2
MPATIKLPGFTDKKVYGIDVLNGFEQELVTEVENDSLVIYNLLVKDYPIILRFSSTTVGIKDKIHPDDLKLDIYPNPFNTTTTIEFQIPERSNVCVKIYNIQGREIRTLINKKLQEGVYKIPWNGLDYAGKAVSAGMYFIRMKSDDHVKTGKSLLLK